jgi:hypothetical protein
METALSFSYVGVPLGAVWYLTAGRGFTYPYSLLRATHSQPLVSLSGLQTCKVIFIKQYNTPLIRINWEDEPSGYAGTQDNWICFDNMLHWQFEVGKKFYRRLF